MTAMLNSSLKISKSLGDSGVQKGVRVGGTAPGIQPGGIQGGSFLKKNCRKVVKN